MLHTATARRLSVAAFAAACVLLAAVGWTSYQRLVDLREATARVDHTQGVMSELETILALLGDAETGQRGFVITGQASYLEPYHAALAALPSHLEQVRRLTGGDARQQANLTILDTLIQQKSRELNATIVARQQGGLAAAARLVRTDEGKRIMDRLRATVEAMQDGEKGLLARRTVREDRAAQAAVATTVGGLSLALSLMVAATALLNHVVRERVRADIARREAEAVARAIAAAEERLRVTLASIGDAVIATDAAGRVTLMNEVAQALTGWSAVDGAGRPLEDIFVIVNEQTRRPVENPVHKVTRDGTVAALANHTVLIARDGREIPIDDSAAPIRRADGSLLGVVLVFRDITDRRRAERERAALLEQERAARIEVERRTQTLQHVQAITDAALLDLGLDDTVRALLARTRAALASDTVTMLLLEPDGRELVVSASDGLPEEVDAGIRVPVGQGVAGRIAATERGLVIDDVATLEVVSPFLRAKVTSLVGAPLKIERRLIGVLHAGAVAPGRFREADLDLLRIVADRVALVLERARLRDEERAARAGAETARQEAERANQAKDQFLAMLSHELRTPLTTMRGWLQLLRGGQLDPPKQERALETVERSTRALTRMIDDLLDVSRIAAGKMALEPRPTRLGPVVAETVASLEQEARAKGLTLEAHVDPTVGVVFADQHRMRQLLMNLLVNAMKFTPAGGRVQVDLVTEDDAVRIAVRDTGIGIERDLLSRVFERFRQADRQVAGTPGGLGLGLTIVREIVQLHGGTVRAESDGPGKGATFLVTLPVVRGATDSERSAGA